MKYLNNRLVSWGVGLRVVEDNSSSSQRLYQNKSQGRVGHSLSLEISRSLEVQSKISLVSTELNLGMWQSPEFKSTLL